MSNTLTESQIILFYRHFIGTHRQLILIINTTAARVFIHRNITARIIIHHTYHRDKSSSSRPITIQNLLVAAHCTAQILFGLQPQPSRLRQLLFHQLICAGHLFIVYHLDLNHSFLWPQLLFSLGRNFLSSTAVIIYASIIIPARPTLFIGHSGAYFIHSQLIYFTSPLFNCFLIYSSYDCFFSEPISSRSQARSRGLLDLISLDNRLFIFQQLYSLAQLFSYEFICRLFLLGIIFSDLYFTC